LISSTNDNIFGGFTPIAWNSRNDYVADSSLQSFVFTIKNPHNLPARIFRQKDERYAIYDNSSLGPTFGNCALYVCDKCQNANSSSSNLDNHYDNDTGIQGNQVLTGAQNFTVKEIEVFDLI
jgi:hypothetical protein